MGIRLSAWAAVAFNLALAVGQIALFLPDVAVGWAVDSGVYRVDGLGLVLGVAWCVGAALAARTMHGREIRGWAALAIGLMSVAALNMSYAREPLLFYAAWEGAGLGLWLMARYLSGKGLRAPGWALHIAGWPLLLVIVLGLVPAFAPPFGGEAQAWPAWVCVILGVATLMRAGAWPFGGWARIMQGATHSIIAPMLALYALLATFVLAKALAAAPWEPLGVWALVLLGTLGLLGSVATALLNEGGDGVLEFASACTSAAVIGLGLAPGSPLAAVGALALVLAGSISARLLSGGIWGRLVCMAGTLLGVWLITQAALSQGYGIVVALLLPALVLITLYLKYSYQPPATSQPATIYLPAATFVALFVIYPQALYWLALQPAVGAMAGGVGAPNQLAVDWGVGLRVEAVGGALVAALPATGIATALFLIWAALYWLRGIVLRFYPGESEPKSEQGSA